MKDCLANGLSVSTFRHKIGVSERNNHFWCYIPSNRPINQPFFTTRGAWKAPLLSRDGTMFSGVCFDLDIKNSQVGIYILNHSEADTMSSQAFSHSFRHTHSFSIVSPLILSRASPR